MHDIRVKNVEALGMKPHTTLSAKLLTPSTLLLLSAFANAETYFTDISYSLLRGREYEVGES